MSSSLEDAKISSENLANNLAGVKASIGAAEKEALRKKGAVNLVAVSKTHGPETIEDAIQAGQKIFGENRVQEAEAKWPDLKERNSDIRLHLIGPLQRNKAALAVSLFDVIETIDRLKLATALTRHMEEIGRRPNCFIQVNTGEESQKAGILPRETDAFIAKCRTDLNLPIVGLMCIPPVDEEPSLHFALLREIAERNELPELSMGMSADFETAIQFGATYVRVGTAIFGPRSDYWQSKVA
ncbi:MAG: YggS family pyridoxal phosphate-dependent enzyme [Rhodospirillales bacterium]|jgi:pyridoxal phosphate enzyme (YggS family)